MGTNYYMITKNKDLVHQYFDYCEYELTDEPDFHYEIHLNKLSGGWKPLFQNHKAFRTFKELEKFYFEHKDDLSFKDEYNHSYSFEEYKQEVVEHSECTPEPVKWVYEESKFTPGRKRLFTKDCNPEEADLWTPFDHIDYTRTKEEARDILAACDVYCGWEPEERYHRDPDYKFDWTEGEFC